MPIFGDNSATGADYFPASGDRALLDRYTLTEDGTADSLSQYWDASSGSGVNFKGLIYTDSSGAPGTLVAVSASGVAASGGGWVTVNFAGESLTAGDYWIGTVCDNGGVYHGADSSGASPDAAMANGTLSYSSPPGTWPGTDASYGIGVNVYVTYTAGGAAEHPSSGALSSQASAVAGTATHLTLHASTGALASQAAAIAGTSVHLTLHATSGALAAQAATVAGSAAHQNATTGALSAQDAAIAGSADHTTAGASHSTSGALAAQDSTVAGSAAHLTLHATTGALAAQASTIAGVAAHQHTTTGALASQDATVAGSAAHLTLHTSSGALASQAATVASAAAHEHAASGALTSDAATISGVAVHAAAGNHPVLGDLVADDAIIVGFASRSGGAPGPGFFNEASGLPGSTAKTQPRVPRVKAPKARLTEQARTVHECTGNLIAGSASISGLAELAALLVQDGLFRSVPKPPMQRSSNEDRIAFLEREVSTLRRALNGSRGTQKEQ